MKAHGVLVLVLLIALLIGGWWALAFFRTPASTAQNIPNEKSVPTATTSAFMLPIVVTHSSTKGVHSYTGSVTSSNACGIKSSGISISGTNPAHVTVLLEASSGECEAVATTSQSTFEVSFKTTGRADPILDSVVVDGHEVSHTLVRGN